MSFSPQMIIIVTVCFLSAAAFILYLLYRRSALQRLAAIPGEIVICEERDVAVVEKRIRYYRNGRCLARLTDRRIVIAQKLPLSTIGYLLRFVIDYHASKPGIDLAAMIKKGYVPAGVRPQQVTVTPEGSGASVTIDIRDSGGKTSRVLSFATRRAGEYQRIFSGEK
ncbi:MAG TPA: hypothetical protein PLD91_01890 [Spirochaetota bacterium]|nr:hypothetical protein [Spirochaetota bacterium]HRS76294.1 hypothetical protein [Spirochaetota bacterium]HRT73983.1 hypothetical protein [Spirochaetota bacterium]